VGGLIFLHDKVTDVPFLVDTGASVSVLPHRSNSTPTGPVLTGADGKNIASWGHVTRKLCFGVQSFLCSFLLAAVSKPILGMDFLAAHRLLVDPFSGTVLNAASLTPIGSAVCTVSKKFIAAVGQIAPAVRELLAAFPSIVGDGKSTPQPTHGVQHFVETTGSPVFAKARRLDPDK